MVSSIAKDSTQFYSDQSLDTLGRNISNQNAFALPRGENGGQRHPPGAFSIELYENKMVRDPIRQIDLRNASDWVMRAKLDWQSHLSSVLVEESQLCDYTDEYAD